MVKKIDNDRKLHVSSEALIEELVYRLRYKEYDYNKLAWLYRETVPKIRSCKWLERERLFAIEKIEPLTEAQKQLRMGKDVKTRSR